MDRMLFLWLVRTALVFPAARSHSLIVESWLPVTTCGIVNRYTYTVAPRVLYTLAGHEWSNPIIAQQLPSLKQFYVSPVDWLTG